jgi:hypothetical protein
MGGGLALVILVIPISGQCYVANWEIQRLHPMDFEDLAYRVSQSFASSNEYIDWANSLLAEGCSNESVAILASFALEVNPDPQDVKRWFVRAVDDLGLAIPASWDEGLIRYGKVISSRIIDGEISPEDGRKQIVDLDAFDDLLIFRIWWDFFLDVWSLANGEPVDLRFNDDLNADNVDAMAIQVAKQFLLLSEMDLPPKFPITWMCSACYQSAPPSDDDKAYRSRMVCPACGTKNLLSMQVVKNREELLKNATICGG